MARTARISLLLLVFGIWAQVHAQSGHRFFFTFGPSVSVQNRFIGNVTEVSAPDITGKHTILPMFSPLWGYPNPQYSGLQNLGRKIHFGLQYERFYSPQHALVTGVELGARGYIIRSDFSNDVLVSYRTLSLPMYYSFSLGRGGFWSFRQNIGLQMNYSSSIESIVEGLIAIHKGPKLYPTLHLALELVHRSFSAPFGFEVSYDHGFSNILNHGYLGLNYRDPVPIHSTGSAFKFTVKYLLHERIDPPQPNQPITVVLTKYDKLAYRIVKDPIILKVPSDTVHLCLYDDQTVDGDSIAIEFNNRLIYKDIAVLRSEKCFDIVLQPGKKNQLIVHALNQGKIPPNTCVVRVQVGDAIKEVRLRSDLETSGTIEFMR